MDKENIYWNSDLYSEKHAFVYKYGEELIKLLMPASGEKILDLGCGNGHLSQEIALNGAEVLGVDSSPDMIEAAKLKYPGVNFLVSDAVSMEFDNQFDAVFSNAVMHWVCNPKEAATRIYASLKPGGKFVAEFGGKGNNAGLLHALKNAFADHGLRAQATINFWYFPSLAEYATLLENSGLEVSYACLFPRLTALADPQKGVKDWFRMFGERFFVGMEDALIDKVLTTTQDLLRPTHFMDGKWYADYVRLRIVAKKSV